MSRRAPAQRRLLIVILPSPSRDQSVHQASQASPKSVSALARLNDHELLDAVSSGQTDHLVNDAIYAVAGNERDAPGSPRLDQAGQLLRTYVQAERGDVPDKLMWGFLNAEALDRIGMKRLGDDIVLKVPPKNASVEFIESAEMCVNTDMFVVEHEVVPAVTTSPTLSLRNP